jgi:hypothetical protein
MLKVLKELLQKISGVQPTNTLKPIARAKQPNSSGDFRAVEIEPSSACCEAAMQARGRTYLLRGAPRLPLYGCTMPTKCSCKFRKHADRRDSDRRLFGGTETNRWFVGRDNRNRGGRRSTEQ